MAEPQPYIPGKASFWGAFKLEARLRQASSEPAQQEPSIRPGSCGTTFYLYVKQTTALPKPQRVFPLPLTSRGNLSNSALNKPFRLDAYASSAERRERNRRGITAEIAPTNHSELLKIARLLGPTRVYPGSLTSDRQESGSDRWDRSAAIQSDPNAPKEDVVEMLRGAGPPKYSQPPQFSGRTTLFWKLHMQTFDRICNVDVSCRM